MLGPNTTEGGTTGFPTPKVDLASAQQDLVVAAMVSWVQDADDATATTLLAAHKAQLASTTCISYLGTGNLTTNGDYAHTNGSSVWIELVCQTGVIFRNNIHYHSIWHDWARDYQGNFYPTFASTKSEAAATVFSAYPNPVATGLGLDVVLAKTSPPTTCALRNLLGQTVVSSLFTGTTTKVSTTDLAAGTYVLTVQSVGEVAITAHVTLE